MIGMKKLKLDKNLKSSLITYGMVIVAYIVMQTLVMTDNISSLMEGLLVPLCIYSIMAVSLNLTVGILGELSLGHAGFMCIGAFAGAFFSKCTNGAMPDLVRFVCAILIGAAVAADVATINKYLALPEVRDCFPSDVAFKWAIKGDAMADGRLFLYAIKVERSDGKAPLDGSVISDARATYA